MDSRPNKTEKSLFFFDVHPSAGPHVQHVYFYIDKSDHEGVTLQEIANHVCWLVNFSGRLAIRDGADRYRDIVVMKLMHVSPYTPTEREHVTFKRCDFGPPTAPRCHSQGFYHLYKPGDGDDLRFGADDVGGKENRWTAQKANFKCYGTVRSIDNHHELVMKEDGERFRCAGAHPKTLVRGKMHSR